MIVRYAPGTGLLKPPEFNRNEISLEPAELALHVRGLLDDTHRELAWMRAALIGFFYALLAVTNYLTLEADMNVTAAIFALFVAVSFSLFAAYHRFSTYPAYRTNLVTFVELCVLQLDAIAFSIVTDNLMSGFGVYLMIIGAGVFMTSVRWVLVTGVLLLLSWIIAVVLMDASIDLGREAMMLIATLCGAYFFFAMRVKSATRLGEHQMMEQKYKETLENALLHIETLSGLLPICANCKSIRSEDNEWTDLDIYVRDRLDVEFTHSVCPDCQKALYPEFTQER